MALLHRRQRESHIIAQTCKHIPLNANRRTPTRVHFVTCRHMRVCACREEGQKFNIWQAWLNLENMYGSPTPDEAVTRLFQRALPYCNAKKLYLALLDILERTNKVSCSLA